MKKIYSLLLLAGICLFGAQNVMAQDSWTVAGSSAVLFGLSWDADNTDNDMVYNEETGLYEFSRENVTLDGSVQFKILKNHSWSDSYPDDNYETESLNGEYNILITFNATTKGITFTATPISVNPDTWTVAGSSTDVFGTSWDPTNTVNDMILDGEDGLYKFSKENVELAAGEISFKVVKNHSWTVAYPAQNYVHNIATAGIHNITITFNADTKVVNVIDVLVEEEIILPTVSLAGTFNNWTAGADVLEVAEGGLTCSISKHFTPGVYLFQFVVGGEWKGNTGEYTRTNEGQDWEFESGYQNNCSLLVDLEGDYLFTFTYEGVKGAVTGFPTSFTRVAANDNYQTLCVPFEATITNATVYDVAEVGEYVKLAAHEGNLEAGHSYIIKPVAVGDMVISKVAEGTSVAAPVNTYLYGILGADYQPTASLNAYVLSNNEFRLVADDGVATVASTKAYLKKVTPGAPALRVVVAENEATAIENIEDSETAVKFIENGKFFIMKNGVVYDATGAVVK